MRAVFLPVAVLAAAVSAQSSSAAASPGTSECAAQNILETCLATTQGYLSACSATDYTCLCDKYTAIMTCFNNCPNDPQGPSFKNSQQLNCQNASLYATSTTTTSTGSAKTATTTPTTTTGEGTTKTGSATATSTSAQKTNAAGELAPHMLAAVAGVVVAMI